MIFSESDKNKIAEAVKEVEKHTSGEIVPYFVRKSDDYREVKFFMALIFGVISCLTLAILSYWWLLPFQFTIIQSAFLILTMMFTGYFLANFIPGLVRVFVPASILSRRTMLRAEAAFLEEEVFNTRDRTGILLFISALEHQVLVIGDTGINKRVKPEEWSGVVNCITQGMKQKKMAQGIVDAIMDCKTLLQREGIEIKPDDTNELSNEIRIRD